MPRRNDSLLRALVASPHALPPPHPQALTVAPQRPLPAQLGFGPASPSALGRGTFSGAVTKNPLSVVHPQPQAEFQPPAYAPLQPIRAKAPDVLQNVPAVLSALAQPAAGSTGAAAGAAATAQGVPTALPPNPPFTSPAIPSVQYNQQGNTIAVPQKLPTVTAGGQVSSALIAAFAQIRQRLGTSRSGVSYY
jgi:hypothetical protein